MEGGIRKEGEISKTMPATHTNEYAYVHARIDALINSLGFGLQGIGARHHLWNADDMVGARFGKEPRTR